MDSNDDNLKVDRVEPLNTAPVAKDPFKEPPIKDFSYVNQPNSQPTEHKSRRKWPIILVIILIVVGLAGAYFGLTDHKAPKPAKTATTSNSQMSTTKTNKAPVVPTTTYNFAGLGLSVNYPSSWTVSTSGSSLLDMTSPVTQIVNDQGKTVSGKIVIQVQPQGQIPAAFGTSGDVAVLNSQLVSYSSPSTDQAAQTYVSFVQYATTNVLGGLDAIYVTGNDGYLKDQNIPNSDIAGLDPLVTVSFLQCSNSSCTNPTNLTISSNNWSNLDFQTPILDTIKSFTFT